ncbi:chloride intracellular channel protein 3 isoform X1 [Meles meles]|uniref:chloride intracellular channel protein 3 isoform X1 n=1 Tax=Meles meles TaxID=9662 RepID=UPI001E698EE6|nr:chloride intracellular channel protein 3 isoform X1 [Meles meles]
MAETAKLQLFVKASEDGESVGPCPSCQRLFMLLLLKGVPFTLTTVDTRRSLDVLKDFAPGSQLPILLYDGDAKTDTLQIEEFLEETLGPPEFPSLAPRYGESTTAGNDVFHRFSAFIKNPVPTQDDALYQMLLRALTRLDGYLSTPLGHERAREPELRESRRRFLDGDQLTLADCSLLPKLHIVDVSGRAGRGAQGAGRALHKALTSLRPSPADGVHALPPGAHTGRAARRPPLPGQRAASEGVQVHVSIQR